MKFLSYIISMTTLFLASHSYAFEEDSINNCSTTPAIWQIATSPDINTTNNLRRREGSAEFAKGEFIAISGRVVDSNCVPVVGAIVEIWQSNYLGLEQYKEEDNKKNFDNNFISSGRSITDNMGYYNFLTIMPGAKEKSAPHINFRIRHRDFMVLETAMFFENQSLNNLDNLLINNVAEANRYLLVAKGEKINKNSIEEGIKYRFGITLEGKNKYLTY